MFFFSGVKTWNYKVLVSSEAIKVVDIKVFIDHFSLQILDKMADMIALKIFN